MRYQIRNAKVQFGADTILNSVNFEIHDTEKIAIVGRNGCGKTTLLRLIAGDIEMSNLDSDETCGITMSGKQNIGFLRQINFTDGDVPVKEELEKAFSEVFACEARKKEIEKLLAETEDHKKLLAEYDFLERRIESLHGYSWKKDMETMFQKFGFALEDLEKPIGEFSGGQQTKIALIQLLLQRPDILLLDEPTNHLDLRSVEWLEGYIQNFRGTVLAISHDRYFIDQIAQRVIEIADGHAEFYSGNYSFYMDEKQARFDLQMKQYEQEQAKLKQLGYTVERMKGWGINNRTLYRRAMSIQHRMDRIRKTERPKAERTMKASFGERDFSGDVVFKMKNVSKSFGDRTLFSDVNLLVEGGERIALLGDNGTGKSTFIKCLLGEEDCQGKIQFGPTVKWGYLPQIIHFDHPERSLYDTMLYEKNCTPQMARDRLGAFLFQGEDVFKTVGNLSGGEQSRLRLCMLMDEKINLLILDEPTNHLDIASREWVEAAIEEFEGVLLFVSHDRYFIEKFAERIWLLEDGKIRDFPCGYQKYRSILEHEAAAKPAASAAPKPKKERAKGGTKDADKLVRRLEREIEKQEQVVADFDRKIEAASADYQELTRLLGEKEEAEAALMDLMEQWEQVQT